MAVTRIQIAVVTAIIVVAVIAAVYYATLTSPRTPTTKPEPTTTPTPTPQKVENVGEKYNTTLNFWEDHTTLEYTDEDGEHSETYFEIGMRSGLDWIKTNTPEDAVFLCWWDYGHMIRGYAERNAVVRNPSKEIADTVGDPSSIKEFDSHDKIFDVATALATNDFHEMLQILKKYSVTHVLVSSDDFLKAPIIYGIAGYEWTDNLERQDSSFIFTDVGAQTMIARLLENRDTGFTLVYEDQKIKVYQIY